MYLVYCDDSDTKQKANKWQVMSAVLVKDDDFRDLELVMSLIADDFLSPEKMEVFTEFHACELYGGYGVFEGIQQSQRFDMIGRLLSLLKHLHIVYGAVNLKTLQSSPYASADPVDVVFRMCATLVEGWITQRINEVFQQDPYHEEMRHHTALLIADDCDPKTKSAIQKSFRQLRSRLKITDVNQAQLGAASAKCNSGLLSHIHDDMYFGDSKFSIGIQLADLCSYFIARHLEGDLAAEGFYKLIEPHIVLFTSEP